ncbi:hypothetical protein [Hymenobacter sp.]
MRETAEAGCLLVRPDGYIGWRAGGPRECRRRCWVAPASFSAAKR